MSVQQELLDILVCPLCLGKLDPDGDFLVCRESGLKYPIRDDIPIMLPEEAVLPAGCASLDEVPCSRKRESRSPGG